MELPYITDPLRGIGGKLRAVPEHFVVQELPLYEPQGEGSHLYLNFTKTGLTTKQVTEQIERMLKLRRGDVGYAGLKDKYACTTQTISLPLDKPTVDVINTVVDQVQSSLPITLNWARLHRNKLKAGHLLGNRFRITLSGLGMPGAEALTEAQKIAAEIQRRGVPNYFGVQRFGNTGDNADQGRAILLGERTQRDSWMRRFLLSSYQSALCNRYLARRVQQGLFDRIIAGDVAKKYETGGIFDVTDPAVEQQRFDAHEISFTAPIYGYKMRAALAEAANLEAGILMEEGLTLDHWRKAHIDGGRRLGRLLINDLALEMGEEGLVISFSLPKGAYATTLLREFMKNESAEMQAEDESSSDFDE